MELTNQIMYLGAALVTLVIALNSSVELKTRIAINSSGLYWSIAGYLMALSCFSFVFFPWSGKALTIGDLLQLGSDIALGLLFRAIYTQITKKQLVYFISGTLATCMLYVWVVINGNYGARVELIAISTILLSLWQLYELHGCFKKDKSYYLRFIYLAIFVQIALLVSRVIVTGLDLSAHASIFDEHEDEFFIRLAYIFCYIAIFIFLGNYFYNNLWKLTISLHQKLEDNILSILNSLALARDNETGHHILRTQKYVHALAIRLKSIGFYGAQLEEAYVDILYKAAPLHDIGKVGIPDQILNKPGRLTVEERNIMMTHAAMGASILEVAKDKIENTNDVLSVASTIAESHHEKWDGTGYPAGLKGNAIPLSARIMALADVYDALTSVRPYKKAWTHEDASEEIIRNSGIAFDPAVVEAFISEKSYFKEVAEGFYLEERAVSAAIGS